MSADEVCRLVAALRELAASFPLGRTAIVVDTDVAYGVLRMIEMLVDDAAEIRPFRSEEDAEEWLEE